MTSFEWLHVTYQLDALRARASPRCGDARTEFRDKAGFHRCRPNSSSDLPFCPASGAQAVGKGGRNQAFSLQLDIKEINGVRNANPAPATN